MTQNHADTPSISDAQREQSRNIHASPQHSMAQYDVSGEIATVNREIDTVISSIIRDCTRYHIYCSLLDYLCHYKRMPALRSVRCAAQHSDDTLVDTTRNASHHTPTYLSATSSRALTASAEPTLDRVERKDRKNNSALSAGQIAAKRRLYFWRAIRAYSVRDLSKLLIDIGRDVDTETRDGTETALTFLAQAPPKYQEMANNTAAILLHALKADINAASLYYNRTALHWAACFGEKGLVKLLMQESFGTDLNAQDAKGRTPAMLAAEQGYQDLASRILRDGRARPDIQDERGRTAMDYIETPEHAFGESEPASILKP